MDGAGENNDGLDAVEVLEDSDENEMLLGRNDMR